MRRHLNKVRMSEEVIKETHCLKNKQLKLSSGENNLGMFPKSKEGEQVWCCRRGVPGQSTALGDTVGEQSRFWGES